MKKPVSVPSQRAHRREVVPAADVQHQRMRIEMIWREDFWAAAAISSDPEEDARSLASTCNNWVSCRADTIGLSNRAGGEVGFDQR